LHPSRVHGEPSTHGPQVCHVLHVASKGGVMGRIGYTVHQKAEAVALAAIVGADQAGKTLGIQSRSIRRWGLLASTAPADALPAHDWKTLGALARARVAHDLASGKMTTVASATVAAIAQRNEIAAPPPAPPPTRVEQWGDEVEAALDEKYGPDGDLALLAAMDFLATLDTVDGAHLIDQPEAVGAGRPLPVPSIPELVALDGIGDLHEWRRARQAASVEAMHRQLKANRAQAEASISAMLDAETRALIEAAERWLSLQAQR